jgi:hypothetical protein
MCYCDIESIIKIIEECNIDYEYIEPNRDLICFEYYKDMVYSKIKDIL